MIAAGWLAGCCHWPVASSEGRNFLAAWPKTVAGLKICAHRADAYLIACGVGAPLVFTLLHLGPPLDRPLGSSDNKKRPPNGKRKQADDGRRTRIWRH